MKFAVIGPTFPFRGGISHHTTLLVRHLREAGHDVLFISYKRQYPKLLYGRSDQDTSRSIVSEAAEYLIDSINPLTWRAAAQKIDQFDPDRVILPWWVVFWAPLTRYFAQRFGQKMVILVHNTLPHEPRPGQTVLTRFALNPVRRFVTHSREEGRKLRDLLTAPDETFIQYYPHPTYREISGSVLRTDLPIEPPKRYLLMCGLIRAYKGLDLLIEAMAAVRDRFPDVKLLVCGEFWESAAEYETQIASLGLEDQIAMHDGYLPNEQLVAYIEGAEAVVLPYRSATQSGVAKLALGHGAPIVVTDVGDLKQLVGEETLGLAVPPNDAEALAAALIRFFEEDLGPNMRDHIAAEGDAYSWEGLIDVIVRMGVGT